MSQCSLTSLWYCWQTLTMPSGSAASVFLALCSPSHLLTGKHICLSKGVELEASFFCFKNIDTALSALWWTVYMCIMRINWCLLKHTFPHAVLPFAIYCCCEYTHFQHKMTEFSTSKKDPFENQHHICDNFVIPIGQGQLKKISWWFHWIRSVLDYH